MPMFLFNHIDSISNELDLINVTNLIIGWLRKIDE